MQTQWTPITSLHCRLLMQILLDPTISRLGFQRCPIILEELSTIQQVTPIIIIQELLKVTHHLKFKGKMAMILLQRPLSALRHTFLKWIKLFTLGKNSKTVIWKQICHNSQKEVHSNNVQPALTTSRYPTGSNSTQPISTMVRWI